MRMLKKWWESRSIFKSNIFFGGLEIRDTLDIINGNKIVGLTNEEMSVVDKYDKKTSFTKMHHFFKSQKHYILNKFISEPS